MDPYYINVLRKVAREKKNPTSSYVDLRVEHHDDQNIIFQKVTHHILDLL